MDTHISKSHVLAGVQDAYWSDDEGEDADCPLCLEEMDLSDMGFKPCPCGYQICRFCWHHIKENLNGRCPACRRVYTEEAVQFKAVNQEDLRRLNQQKKIKEREKKELDALNRKHLTNVRVVQRSVVYITGVGPRFAREELIPTLRSHEYFGQYGKISKILIVKRTSPSGNGKPVVGLYVTYYRREDASRAITAVDGTPSPSGGREVTRASYGTTKYCIAFLRGVGCNNKSCLDLHEWGDEQDCFTKEDLATLKHAMKDTELNGKKSQEEGDVSATRRSTWTATASTKSNTLHQTSAASSKGLLSSSSLGRGKSNKEQSSSLKVGRSSTRSTGTVENTTLSKREREPPLEKDRTKHSLTAVLTDTKQSDLRPVSPGQSSSAGRSHTPQAESERGSFSADAFMSPTLDPALGNAAARAVVPATSQDSVLSAPPGLPAPSTSGTKDNRLQLSFLGSTYQPSTAAQALVDDVRSRRHQFSSHMPGSGSNYQSNPSPFPDFDRTLRNLGLNESQDGDGSLKFSFDFEVENSESSSLPTENLELDAPGLIPRLPLMAATSGAPINSTYSGSFNPFDASPSGNEVMGTPSEYQRRVGYRGSFDPFAENDTATPVSKPTTTSGIESSADGERTTSRFGFARRPTANRSSLVGNHNHSNQSSVRGSPLLTSPADVLPASPYLSHADVISPKPAIQDQGLWQSPGSSVINHPEASQGPPPGLIQSPSISLNRLFGAGFGRRNSFKGTVDNGPPGLGNTPLLRTSELPRGAGLGRIDEQHLSHENFVDPAIISTRLAPAAVTGTLALATRDLRIAHINSQSSLDDFSPSYSFSPAGDSFSIASPAPVGSDDSLPSRFRPQSRSNVTINSSLIGSSVPASPMHASHSTPSSPVSSVPQSGTPSLSASDFPALPSSNINEGSSRGQSSQPHIIAIVPKVQELKQSTNKNDKKKETSIKKSIAESQLSKGTNDDRKKVPKPVPKLVPVPLDAAPKLPPINSALSVDTMAPAVTKQKVHAHPKPPIITEPEPESQAPLLSRQAKKEKKSKPKTKPTKSSKDDEVVRDATKLHEVEKLTSESLSVSGPSQVSEIDMPWPQGIHPHAEDQNVGRASIVDLLTLLDRQMQVCLDELAFFNPERVKPRTQAPLEYGPLVHALSALSVGGGTFSNNLPSRSIDTAVSSFQTLLETLTQTISDLLRLLPRTTWDDSSSFDGVLRDMLKGDDFLDEPGEEASVKEDEVAALTQALERRARWMEVQLSKLEELHRDINTAAVRAVLAFNDRGWDRLGFLPRSGDSLRRFDLLGQKEIKGKLHDLNIIELERRLESCQEAERVAESELRKSVDSMVLLKYKAIDDWAY